MTAILLVDDDGPFRRTLAEQLRDEQGFETSEAENAAAGMAAVQAGHFDLILLDVGLPDMDGRDLCRAIRARGVATPVIMLTAADEDLDAIRGLDSGANDYVAKPVRIGLLLARIRAQLRAHAESERAEYVIGPYLFRPAAKLLQHQETKKKVRLTDKEVGILRHLQRAAGKSVARETLLTEVWGYNAGVTTHTLETHIYRLRQKIESAPGQNAILVTDEGGYRLVP
ncbi:MAG: response regulator transcription factor [Alphaproteobacteria bacterium]